MTDAMDLSLLVSRRVADLLELANDNTAPEGMGMWFFMKNRKLDNKRPIDVLRESGGIRRLEALLEGVE